MLLKEKINGKDILSVGFNDKEFAIFFKIFYNFFIKNGKKSFSVKYIDNVFYEIKKNKLSPLSTLTLCANKLLPIIGSGKKKVGKRNLVFPFFLVNRKKYVILFNWLIRSLRNKSNIFGVKSEQLVSNIVESSMGKGKAMNQKKLYYKKALAGRFLLSNLSKVKKRIVIKKKR